MVKIYILIDPISNIPRYVGKTIQELRIRLNRHVVDRTKANTHKNNWIKRLKKNDLRPNIELLENVPLDEWEFWEQYWISQFKTWGFRLTNSTPGGEGATFGGSGCKGYRHTEEAKRKISQANSKPRSKTWVENQCKSRFKSIEQYKDNILIQTWESATTAALSMGDINRKKNISACAKGKKKTAYGYVWKFKI
jgi:hypothetical protein